MCSLENSQETLKVETTAILHKHVQKTVVEGAKSKDPPPRKRRRLVPPARMYEYKTPVQNLKQDLFEGMEMF